MSTPEHVKVANALDRMMKRAKSKAGDPRHAGRRKEALTNLGSTLDQAKTEWDKLKDDSAKPTDKDKNDYNQYAKALAKGLPKLENGIIDAVGAFETGDPYAEAASVLDICATLVSTLGACAGPEGQAVGKLLGTLLGMIGPILGMFEPKKPSLLNQIKELLKQEQAKDEINQLKLALEDFTAFEDAWKAGYWKPVNLQNGSEIKQVRLASIWLKSADNQTDGLRKLWFQLLELQCQTFIEVVKAVPHALGALNKYRGTDVDKFNAAGLLTVGLYTAQNQQLEFLQAITEYIQNCGMFFYVGTGKGSIYVGSNLNYRNKPQPGFRDAGGSVEGLSVVIAKAEMGKPDPDIHVFFLHSRGRIGHGHMRWPSGGLENYSDLPVEDVEGCTDIWAIYDPADPDGQRVAFFTAHRGKELHGYRLGENNGKGESKVLWREPVDKVTSIRAVQFPQSIPGDPDENPENPRVLDDISWIVYGGCKSTSDIWVWASNGKKGFVRFLYQGEDSTYDTIGVDQQYLWTGHPPGTGGGIATHTSVLRALTKGSQPPRPTWTGGVEVTAFSPCDDGTMFYAYPNNHVEYAPLRFVSDPGGTYIIFVGYSNLGDTAVQTQKLPNYDWPLVGGMIRVLEEKVKEAKAARVNLTVVA